MATPAEVDKVLGLFADSSDAIDFAAFARMYNEATAAAGMPGLEEFREAFTLVERFDIEPYSDFSAK